MNNQHNHIKGYRDLSQDEIDLMNQLKELASQCGTVCELLKGLEGLDQRWIAIGTTDLQKGFMSLIRGVAQPTSF